MIGGKSLNPCNIEYTTANAPRFTLQPRAAAPAGERP